MNDVSVKKKYFWNMMGSLCNAFSTVILLLVVNWILGNEAGGIFSFAYSNAQMLMIIGGLEVYPIQTTDVEEEYSFQTYFTLRIITCFLMLFISICYIYITHIEGERACVVLTFCVFKMIESFVDVFGGMYQQNNRIDLTGKILSLRVAMSTISFIVILLITHDLLTGAISMAITSLILFFIYDLRFLRFFPSASIGISLDKVWLLIKEVVPLFIAAFIMSYISNAPKYAIDTYCSDMLQNKYGILFMPAFVINLFSLFVFRPILVDMTEKWNRNDLDGVVCYIKRSVWFIVIITILCVVGGIIVGIPVLSFVYGVDLVGERVVLGAVMVYGGFTAFSTYFYYVITVMRMQKKMLVGYIVSFVLVTLAAPVLVKKFELLGAAMTSLIGVLSLDVIFAVIMIRALKTKLDR